MIQALILAVQVTVGAIPGFPATSLQAITQACWEPRAGVGHYEVWVGSPGSPSWTPLRHGIRCSTGPCCAEPGVAWGNEEPVYWMVVGYADPQGGMPNAWSVPMLVDVRKTARYTSNTTPPTNTPPSAPILRRVTS